MFTGIVEGVAKILSIVVTEGRMILILTAAWLDDLAIGDSLAVNGVCLTVTTIDGDHYHFDIVPETLQRTNLGQLKENDAVNIERSLQVGERIGGHFVQGHIDTVGEIIEWREASDDSNNCYLAKISIDKNLAPYLVNKGFITIDGMSITIIEASDNYFTVTLIPHTVATTVAKSYQCGSRVNIETDVLGKYIVKLNQKNEANYA
ncbi:MAG: riboflavin synthase [Gammaproteobacteria bacterium]|nr:riboflavin synthase [Gammaproteobacteria bacterium]